MDRTKLIKSEVLKIFKTTKETLRHYENLGLIQPEIDKNNYRYYDHHDLKKLRQIFYLREIEIPLEKIKELNSKQVSQDEYHNLLDYHYISLKEKVERQKENLEKTEKLLSLLKNDSFSRIFTIQKMEKRSYLTLSTPESEEPLDSKSYYDLFFELIEREIYTERSFLMIYPYMDLLAPSQINGVQCLKIRNMQNKNIGSIEIFPKGKYLSIFYLYRDDKKDDLISLYTEIENYLSENQLQRIGTNVIEMEHPELSIIYDDNTTIYELQFQIADEVINGKNIYDKHYQTPDYFGKPYPGLVDFFKGLNRSQTILDLGCGQGRDLFFLAKMGFNMIGVDHSTVGIEQLRKRALQESLKISVEVADIYDYPIPQEVDIVLMDSMLHFYKNDIQKETKLVNSILNQLQNKGLFCNCLIKGDKRELILKEIIENSKSEWHTIYEDYIKYPENNSEYHLLVIQKRIKNYSQYEKHN